MRAFLLALVSCCFLIAPLTAGEDLKPGEVLEALKVLELKTAASQKYLIEVKPDSEQLVFAEGVDEVVLTRTFGKIRKVTQVFTVLKERATLKDGVLTVPLRWTAIDNPTQVPYQPDKHDAGLRIARADGKWTVRFYAIDAKGHEAGIQFEQHGEPPAAAPPPPQVVIGPAHRPAELTVDDALNAVRAVKLNIAPGQKYIEKLPPERELFTFDQGRDEVLWVRTFGKGRKVTQVYSIAKDAASAKENVVAVPLRWKSIQDSANAGYSPEKNNVGLRICRNTTTGKWIVRLYAADTAGNDLELKFLEE